jgi:hypothetical protein
MMRMDLVWLGATLVQVLGVSLGLAALGFAYARSLEQGQSLLAVLERDRLIGWLALGAALLAVGMAFSEANWLQKGAAVGLALCLAWAAGRK